MPERGHLYQTVIVGLLLATGRSVVAGDGSRSPETDLAAPGAPLYEYALTESVKSLISKQEQAELGAQGRPPSPGPDYFWCENCKTYHKRQTPASAQQPVGEQGPDTTPASPPQPAAARPPSPGPDSFWCNNCKTYHKRQTVPNQPGAAAPRGSPPVESVAGARPPSPGPESFWCENCKTYHKRQTPDSVQQPVAPQANTAPAGGTVAAQAQSGDYYYCENCKTYHRRQPVAQDPVLGRIVGGVTNSPNRSPLTSPAGAEL